MAIAVLCTLSSVSVITQLLYWYSSSYFFAGYMRICMIFFQRSPLVTIMETGITTIGVASVSGPYIYVHLHKQLHT